jgi:superfamily II DNA or RNA helicase
MVVLKIDNSTAKVTGLTTAQFKALRKLLSYQTQPAASYYTSTFYRTKFCIDARGEFLTGLLPRVIKYLKSNNIMFQTEDTRVVPTKKVDHRANFGDIKPYEAQVAAVERLLIKGQGIISAPTGSGKSLIIALITANLGVKTLIVVPSLQIKEQLTESLERIFKDMSNITVENIDSKALKQAKAYDCLIIDEAHHSAAKTYQKLNKSVWRGIFYRAFLTATPFRNQTEETMLFEGIAGQVIYRLTYQDAVKAGYIVPIEAYYLEIPKQKTEAEGWQQVYSQLVVKNQIRNEMIGKTLLMLSLSNVSTLCLVKEIAHGNLLEDSVGVLFANGQDETTRNFIEMFNKRKITSLIGTTGIIGEGVDTKPCEFVIVAGLGKAKSAFMQQVGRALRTYPGKESGKVIIIKDKSHKYLLRHFNEQVKILEEEYGVIPSKLELE